LNCVKTAGTLVAIGVAALTIHSYGRVAVAQDQPESRAGFEPIKMVVEAAIARHELPGAVVLVGSGDAILYHAALGDRALQPSPERMTEDTIFDVASLTKVVATTTSVMRLVEEGQIRLNDRVVQLIPELSKEDKSGITIRQLLTHTSGLAPDLPLEAEFNGTPEAIRRANDLAVTAPPGEKFIYSDINFFLLGDIVRRVSGERLDAYAKRHVFEPLGMTDSMFLPPASLRPRIAPTERCRPLSWPCVSTSEVPFLRGVVHDPTARRMDHVAGHAGLFSTAADLSRFCRMLLNGGRLDRARILSPATVLRMTSPAMPPGPAGMKDVRGLGWDIDTTYSSNRGDLFPAGTTFGHTGFTGTSLWLDPATKSYVIFLSNRVHPDGKGDVTALRGKVATVAAAALSALSALSASTGARASSGARDFSRAFDHPPTLTGIDVLEAEGFARLRGKRVGLLTNHTGRSRRGGSTIDLLAAAKDVTLVALFSPEHGIRGQLEQENVSSSRDEKTGLPIHSLYGDTRRPTGAMLAGLDAIVVDLQDVGVRFYTYTTSMAYMMEEAAKHKVAIVVLDRPNPVGGVDVDGPSLDANAAAFVAYLPLMPIRHGMTIGELARLFNGEKQLGADLTIVAMQNWQRSDWFDETGLPWTNPSPNMRNMVAASLYPGIGAIEGTNISVGRGTDTPFEHIGAPWIDGVALAAALNARELPGIRFYPVTFTPAAGAKLAGQACHGVFMIVTDRDRLRPVRVGLEIASALSRLHGQQFRVEDGATLFASKAVLSRIRAGDDPAAVEASWQADEDRWRAIRAKYLLYE
jgi:uncharacterized protein YbbC (DUF1343 family)/CubicO group peptidase (beta-lactamase class C family)